MPEYPEHEKRSLVLQHEHTIGEFLDWLTEQGYELGTYSAPVGTYSSQEFYPVHHQPEALLAAYFGIDLNRIEQERKTMLAEQRKLNDT